MSSYKASASVESPDNSSSGAFPPELVKLRALVVAIASQIAVPDELAQRIDSCVFAARPRFEPTGNEIHRALADQLSCLLKVWYREGQAAAMLHFCLIEAEEAAPRWRNWLQTGRPVKLDMDGQRRAMALLAQMAEVARDELDDYLDGCRDLGLTLKFDPSMMFNETNTGWITGLCFERTQIIALLDYAGIRHDLVEPSQMTNIDDEPVGFAKGSRASQDNIHGSVALAAVASALSTRDARDSPTGHAPAEERPVAKGGKKRRNSLDAAIDKAIELAQGSLSTADVWLHMRELALNEELPFSGHLDERGLAYRKDDVLRFLTRDALDSRLRRKKLRGG